MPTSKRTDVTLARSRFKQAEDADKKQRQRELSDLQMYAGDQWPDDLKVARAGQQASNGLPPVPARPCFSINKFREPVRLVLNQERQADIGIQLVPADDFGELQEPINDDEIKLREGLIRRIQRETDAADARTWAFTRAVQAGRGYYAVLTRYVGEGFDQEIYLNRIYNQASVTLDPAHEQPDGSDAEWGFIGTDMALAAYRAKYPRSTVTRRTATSDDQQWRALGDEAPEWFTSDGDTPSVRVVDYWWTERTSRTRVQLADGQVAWQDELPEGFDEAQILETRTVDQKQVVWSQINGIEVLDESDWPSPYLPIVKVLGEELQPYDRERRAEGMIRPGRDAQMGFNAMVSKWVEQVALTTIPPYLMADGQWEGYEEWWRAQNTRTLPYLPYRNKDSEGTPIGRPERSNANTDNIGALAASVQMFDEAMKSTTGVPSVSLGQTTDSSLKSGRAIRALQQQGEQGIGSYLDNLTRSIRHEGRLVNSLLKPIYSRPGRLARMVNGEGEAETVLLGQPFAMQGQRPVPAEAGQPGAREYTLTDAASKLNVVVKVTRSFNTRREEEAANLAELLSSRPELLTWFGDLYFANLDGPGHTQMAERTKVMLDPRIQQFLSGQKQGTLPPEAQAIVAQLQGQLQQMQGQLQQAGQIIQTEQTKAQAGLQETQVQQQAENERAQIKARLDLEIARMDNATKLQIEEYKLRGLTMQAELDARERQLGVQVQAQSEDRARAHELGMASMGQETAREEAAEGRAHEAAMAREAQVAALQPESEGV